MLRFLTASAATAMLILVGCIQQDGDSNCAGPGPGAPGSGVDLQVLGVVPTIEGAFAVFRIDYFNAGKEAAQLVEGQPDHLMAIFLDRTECPPAGEVADYVIALPRTIPGEATAQVGISVATTDLVAGNHNVYGRVDPDNATWESDEFNNCFGPTDFVSP